MWQTICNWINNQPLFLQVGVGVFMGFIAAQLLGFIVNLLFESVFWKQIEMKERGYS